MENRKRNVQIIIRVTEEGRGKKSAHKVLRLMEQVQSKGHRE